MKEGTDSKIPAAALMVFQDGAGYIHRDGNNPALNVIDNLIAQKKISAPGTPTYHFVQAYAEQWPQRLYAQHRIRHRQ